MGVPDRLASLDARSNISVESVAIKDKAVASVSYPSFQQPGAGYITPSPGAISSLDRKIAPPTSCCSDNVPRHTDSFPSSELLST
eukprot:scaffold5337_cov167-Amphora_coffeaeformis.AAC.18